MSEADNTMKLNVPKGQGGSLLGSLRRTDQNATITVYDKNWEPTGPPIALRVDSWHVDSQGLTVTFKDIETERRAIAALLPNP